MVNMEDYATSDLNLKEIEDGVCLRVRAMELIDVSTLADLASRRTRNVPTTRDLGESR